MYRWPKSHFTEKKIDYLHYDPTKQAHPFTKARGMPTL